MFVIKRNGEKEPVRLEKIQRRIEFLAKGEDIIKGDDIKGDSPRPVSSVGSRRSCAGEKRNVGFRVRCPFASVTTSLLASLSARRGRGLPFWAENLLTYERTTLIRSLLAIHDVIHLTTLSA